MRTEVWGEMSKNTSYKVDVQIDSHAVVKETQCECGAGQGPAAHCKHVGLSLFAYTKLFQDKEILTEITCTQVLQTFHHAKRHTASPVKCNQLQDIRGKKSLVYDPRQGAEAGLVDRAHNLCINYQANHPEMTPMPILQTIKPANTYALARDHDYLSCTPEEAFLIEQKITRITSDEAGQIEMVTRKQRKSSVWKDQRLQRITSSNFGEICKATDRKDMRKLAKKLTSPSTACGPQIDHGIMYESKGIEWYEGEKQLKTTEAGMFICIDSPFLAASPDAIIDSNTVLEIKCPYTSKDKVISPQSIPYLELCDGELKLKKKHNYYFQIQGQLLCTKCELCHLVVFTLKDQKVVTVNKDDEFIDGMKTKLVSFFDHFFREALLEKLFFKKYRNFSFANEYADV